MEDRILELLGRKDYIPLNVPELLRQLNLPSNQQQELQRDLVEWPVNPVGSPASRGIATSNRGGRSDPGRIRINRQGKGFSAGRSRDSKRSPFRRMPRPPPCTKTASCKADVKPKGLRSQDDRENTGTVIRILERRRTQIVGTLQRSSQFLYVIPDDPRIRTTSMCRRLVMSAASERGR